MVNNKLIICISIVAILLGCGYLKVTRLNTSLLPIVIDGKFGAIDIDGRLVIPTEYEWLYYNEFGNEKIVVEKKKFKSVIDPKNRTIIDSIPYEYDVIVYEKFISCMSNNFKDTLVYDLVGQRVAPIEFREKKDWKFIRRPPNKKNSKKRIFSNKYQKKVGKEIFDFSYTLDNGITLVITNEKWGYIDEEGTFIWSYEMKDMKNYLDVKNATKEKPYLGKSYSEIASTSELIEIYLKHIIINIDQENGKLDNFRHHLNHKWIIM